MIVLAFSGGLDTSFAVPYLKETYKEDVYTVTVDTGGLSSEDYVNLDRRSRELGSIGHSTIDAKADLFDDHLSYLIKGNVLRGNVYPLCVGTERVIQARKLVEKAKELGGNRVAHGSTGAGNDQVRFDVAMRILGQNLEIIAPIRELGYSRAQSTAYLRERGFEVDESTKDYSINKGLWGTTIGGQETLGTRDGLPEEAYPDTNSVAKAPAGGQELTITFNAGTPTYIDGEAMDPVSLIETLNRIGAEHGVGRAIHVGDTILGIKGRVGFEAPAAYILIPAHRELEKIILSKWQSFQKAQLGDFYGMLLHEGQHFDPVMRDIEAYLDSSQERVSGEVYLNLQKGNVQVTGCDSPYSLFNAKVASYGEENKLWDGRDAEGFTRIYGLQGYLTAKAEEYAK